MSARRTLDAPLLLGRYRPIALIARGGMASVFRGHDEFLGRDVAIKVFSGGNEEHIDTYRAELRMLAGLSHHGVVSIIDAGVDTSAPDDPRPFLVMQLVRGTTVRDQARRSCRLGARGRGDRLRGGRDPRVHPREWRHPP